MVVCASVNLLTGNEDVKLVCATHRVHLSQIDIAVIRSRPLSIRLLREHGVRYWVESDSRKDYRVKVLRTGMLSGLSTGLR